MLQKVHHTFKIWAVTLLLFAVYHVLRNTHADNFILLSANIVELHKNFGSKSVKQQLLLADTTLLHCLMSFKCHIMPVYQATKTLHWVNTTKYLGVTFI